ncbi:MAG: glutathione S-transferase family protein [Phyllobacteriaceae bacterium]|nr:glutathione S-transferase family protein [Phyllobacteriaceae bacterium]
MSTAVLTISSKNYSSWSLRGWLIARLSGLPFEEKIAPLDDPSTRAELLLLSPSFLVPCLAHDGLEIWDTLAMAEYLDETMPGCGLIPKERVARAHCRSICGEMHSGFANLRSALPMNLKAHYPNFKVWAGALGDVERIRTIWKEALAASKGPFLFGAAPTMADAMFAPVAARFTTYDVTLDPVCEAYRATIMAWPLMAEWVEAALAEPEELDELDVEF